MRSFCIDVSFKMIRMKSVNNVVFLFRNRCNTCMHKLTAWHHVSRMRWGCVKWWKLQIHNIGLYVKNILVKFKVISTRTFILLPFKALSHLGFAIFWVYERLIKICISYQHLWGFRFDLWKPNPGNCLSVPDFSSQLYNY